MLESFISKQLLISIFVLQKALQTSITGRAVLAPNAPKIVCPPAPSGPGWEAYIAPHTPSWI